MNGLRKLKRLVLREEMKKRGIREVNKQLKGYWENRRWSNAK